MILEDWGEIEDMVPEEQTLTAKEKMKLKQTELEFS